MSRKNNIKNRIINNRNIFKRNSITARNKKIEPLFVKSKLRSL